jgi:beta-glucosidase/6-phospho-beta-glucosidase/beta-galactosidase
MALAYMLRKFELLLRFDHSGHQSRVEPYIAGHSCLIAHANAVALYRSRYHPYQGGQIGITMQGDWVLPYSDTDAGMHHLSHKDPSNH